LGIFRCGLAVVAVAQRFRRTFPTVRWPGVRRRARCVVFHRACRFPRAGDALIETVRVTKRTILFALLLAGSWLLAQANQDQTQQPPKEKAGQVTVQGCVSRSSGDFTLMQSDPGNSYVLRPSGKLKLDPYLGQQVEVTGRETPTMSTSSNYNRRPASAVTIRVDSIKTISKQCGN